MKILIVDDTPTNIDVLVEYLSHDYDIFVALTGRQALDIIAHDKPDLILLDIMMPEMDGFETCLRIKRNAATKMIPVIFLTANADEANIERAFEVGGVDFITKPLIQRELMARIKTHLHLAHYQNQLEDIVDEQTSVITQKSEALLQKLYYDELTGLRNMLSLQEKMPYFIGGVIALVDINNFNVYNKLHGYDFGDKLLQEVGKSLNAMVGDPNLLFKLSADRFAILFSNCTEEEIHRFCDMLYAFFDTTEIVVDSIENLVSFNMGITQVEEGMKNLIDAEFALDLSKHHGKHFKIFYNQDSEDIHQERENILWLNRTREFIYQDKIIPYFQPIVDVTTRQIFKYEALARIDDNGEIILPQQFLGAAERLGLLTSITRSMINKTFQYFSGTSTRFSINITERDIMDGYLVSFIQTKAKTYNIDPNKVTFEVLENLTLSKEEEHVKKTIALVKDYGCNIAIDDFGSENSNFGRILSLRSDYLKIDAVFIKECHLSKEKQQIISAIVQLAKQLEIKTIAEFVSSEEIFQTIKALGVDYAQGYLFGKPTPIASY